MAATPAASSAGRTSVSERRTEPRCASCGPTARPVRGSTRAPTHSGSSSAVRPPSSPGFQRRTDSHADRTRPPRRHRPARLRHARGQPGAPGRRSTRGASTALRARATARGYDRLVVYADREHSANLSYLTGFDPRFEEALLVVGASGDPAILVGNECYGMAGAAPLPMRRHRFQDLSLPGQPRDRSRPLAEILADEGIGPGSPGRRHRLEAVRPARADGCARLPGRRAARADRPDRAGRERRRPAHRCGRRAAGRQRGRAAGDARVCGLPDLERHPPAARRPASRHDRTRGRPAARMGRGAAVVPSDADGRAAGDARLAESRATGRSSAATGSRRRSGSGARSPVGRASSSPTPRSCRPASRITSNGWSAPYFEAVAEWYGALRIGQTGGALFEIIDRRIGDPFFGIFLNPGHQIHLDEWVNSPISRDSTIELRSGHGLPGRHHPGHRDRLLHDEHRGRHRPRRRGPARGASRPATRRRGRGSRRAAGSWPTPSASSSTRTSCRSRTCAAHLPPFLLRPDLAMTMAD